MQHGKEKAPLNRCFCGGDEPRRDINTISRELLNNAYNPRFSKLSHKAKKILENEVF